MHVIFDMPSPRILRAKPSSRGELDITVEFTLPDIAADTAATSAHEFLGLLEKRLRRDEEQGDVQVLSVVWREGGAAEQDLQAG